MKLLRSVGFLLVVLLTLITPCSRHELRPTSDLTSETLLPPVQTTAKLNAGLSQPDPQTRARLSESYGNLPLSFEANQGQADNAVKFLSRGSGYQLKLKANEAVLELRNGSDGADKSQAAIVKMQFVNANPAPQMAGRAELPGKSHYYIGNDPKDWRTNVANYAKVEYEQVWPGINLVYYGKQRQLEYDFIVAPGANPNAIQLAFDGADKMKLDAQGNLVLHPQNGEEGGTVVLNKPFVYQEVNGTRQPIAGSYQIQHPASSIQHPTVNFQIGAYDTNLPLVIDPVLVYSTYLGPASLDIANDIALDQAGNVYITGASLFSSEGLNAFVAKLNAAGTALVYSTAFIGSKDEIGFGIAVDSSGNAYATGYTRSTNFPVKNAFQPRLGATNCPNSLGCPDAFVAKLDVAGTIVYSTYLGGNDVPGDQAAFGDLGYDIAVDGSGQAYVTGSTISRNFPVKNAFQPAGNADSRGDVNDGFITKFSASGTELIYSTYLGGTGIDNCYGIALDAAGNAYVTGSTFGDQTNNFPTTQGAFQRTAPGGGRDSFVTKLNPAGTALVYSTFLGGNNSDEGEGIAVDSAGNAYLVGATSSTNFPLEGAHQSVNLGGSAFVTKLNPSGSGLLYSSYLGKNVWPRTGNSPGAAIAVDAAGIAYVTGSTAAADFPLVNALYPSFGGVLDAYVAKINTVTKTLSYATFLGGSERDNGFGIAIDAAGNAYVTGFTGSTNFPTKNPAQATPGGGGDVFIAKISDEATCPPSLAPEAEADKLTLSNVMPPDGDVVSGASLKLGGVKGTVTWLLQSQEDATLVVRLFDQDGNLRGDAGSITVTKSKQCPPKESGQDFVFDRSQLDLTPLNGIPVTSLKLSAIMSGRNGGIIKRADVNYRVIPDAITFDGTPKINGQDAPDGSRLPTSGTINFTSALRYHLTNDLTGRIRLQAFNANGGGQIASKDLSPAVAATAQPTVWNTALDFQFTVAPNVSEVSIVASLLAENGTVLKTSPPLIYRNKLRIELGTQTSVFGDIGEFIPFPSGAALDAGKPYKLAIKVKDDLPDSLKDSTFIVLRNERLTDRKLIRGPLPENTFLFDKFPRPSFIVRSFDFNGIPDDVDNFEFQLLILPPKEAPQIESEIITIPINRVRITTANPPVDRKLQAGTKQDFIYFVAYNTNMSATMEAEVTETLDKIGDKKQILIYGGTKPAGASSNGEKFEFTRDLPPNLVALKVIFRLKGTNTIVSRQKFYTKFEPPPVTIPAGANKIFGALGIDGTTIENAITRTVRSARNANDAKNAALEGIGLVKSNLLPPPAELRASVEATTEALTTASLLKDFIGINANWQFDPPIPADGSFVADLKFYYSADDLPDDPNFNEVTMKVFGFDPATGKLESYPTTIDLTAKTATVRVNGLMPMYSLGNFGPFAHRTLNFPVLRSLDDFTTRLHFASVGNVNAGLSARAFKPTGQPYSGTGIVNPLTATLPAGRTLSGLASELFKFPAPLDGGWIQTRADKNFITGYQLLGKDNRLDGLGLPAFYAGTQVLTDVQYDATMTTEIHVANVTRFETNLTLELRTAAGALAGSYETTLAPKATFAYRVQDIFTGVAQPFTGYVIVRGSQDFSAAALQISATEITALHGQIALARNTPTKLYAPYVLTDNKALTTRLNLVNPTASAANLTLKLVNETGANLASPVSLQLAPGQKQQRDITQFFNFTPNDLVYGAIIVESNITGIVGNVSYLDPKGQFPFRASLPLESEAAKNFAFAYFDNRQDSFTEVAVFNPQSQTANVTLKVFKADGSAVGMANLNILPGGFYTDLVDSIVSESFGQQGGYFTLSSNQPVLASAAFGTLAGSMIAALPGQTFDPATFTRAATTVSAAHYKGPELAAESIVSAFGSALATGTALATSLPLPTELAGTTVNVRDSAGVARLAPLFYVGPQQINYLIPLGTALGAATITITSSDGTASTGTAEIVKVVPGFFTASQDGTGAPAGFAIRVKPNDEQSREPLARLDAMTGKHVPVPIDLGPAGEAIILELYGTGLRGRSAQSAVSATIGGVAAGIEYADRQPGYLGLDQVNIRVPRSLLGRGAVDLALTVEGKQANLVRLQIK